MKHIGWIVVISMVLAANVSAKSFRGTNGNDTLYHTKIGTLGQATQWADYVWGYGGNDILVVGSGNDYVFGGDGRDYIQGWDGNDKLYGEDGSDIMSGLNGRDYMKGGDGDDYMYGGHGDDWLYGEGGNDRLYGNSGNDYLHGGNGWNVVVQSLLDEDPALEEEDEGPILDGGKGDDIIVFRLRQNMNVRGGAGKDEFIVKGRVSRNVKVKISDIGESATIQFEHLKESEVSVAEENGLLTFSVNGGQASHVFMSYESPDLPGLSTMTKHGGLSPANGYGLTLVFAD